MDEPPLPKLTILGIILLIGMVVPFVVNNATQRNLEANNNPSNSEFVVIQSNSVVGVNIPYFPDFYILGVSGTIEVDLCFYKIIEGESRFNPNAINEEFGEKGGMGLAQIIPKTLKYCEEKLEKKLDPYNPDDNIECALFLYETYGTKPWGDENTWWGSWNYWHEYCY